MAPRTKSAPSIDPDVVVAAEARDRIAAAYEDGVATVEQLEAAEGRLSNTIAGAERRAERAEAVERERLRRAQVQDARAARWRDASPLVAERMIEREAAASALESAFAQLIEAVQAWSVLPALSPLLVDAPPIIATRRDVHPLASAFAEAMRPVAGALGLGHVPLPPPAFRAPITRIIEQVHEPVRRALDAEAK